MPSRTDALINLFTLASMPKKITLVRVSAMLFSYMHSLLYSRIHTPICGSIVAPLDESLGACIRLCTNEEVRCLPDDPMPAKRQ